MGSSGRSPDRESTFKTKVRTPEHELHNRNCTIVRTKCSPPVQRWVGGGIYTPNLITPFQKCPSGPHEGQEVTIGVFGHFSRLDSPTWILLPGSLVFCPSGTFGVRNALVGGFLSLWGHRKVIFELRTRVGASVGIFGPITRQRKYTSGEG